MNIYLIGFMGVGKSTIGAELAARLGYQFIDTDDLIEARQAISISEIFAQKGEKYFRELESSIIAEIAKQDTQIVSCGGGIIKNRDNIRLMRESGKVILLEASADTIYLRVKDSSNRPLLEGRKTIADIQELLDERKALYDMACTDRINADRTTEEVISDIIRLV